MLEPAANGMPKKDTLDIPTTIMQTAVKTIILTSMTGFGPTHLSHLPSQARTYAWLGLIINP